MHKLSIKRPVTTLMVMFIVLVFGAVCVLRLPISLMPSLTIEYAILSVTYSGVAPQEMESIVTRPLESAMATVSNVKNITSISSEGASMIIMEFNSGTNMDFATLDMREKYDLYKGMLPSEIAAPVIMKIDTNMMPIVNMSVVGKKDKIELTAFVEDILKPKLESLNGVASASVSGAQTREIKVELDPNKLSGYGISFDTVIGVLASENANFPGGEIEYGEQKLMLRSTGEFGNIDQIKNIPINIPGTGTVYIRDIAEIVDTHKTQTSYSRMNNEDSIGLSIQKQSDANTVQVINLIKKEMVKLEEEYSDITIDIVFDQGSFIELSVSNVVSNGVMGAILACLILFLFLKDVRTAFIIAISIPISIIGTFIPMYFMGLTFNMISLGGLALGIGMLVDNSIVVLENIYRHMSLGKSRSDAARDGAGEVANAIIASTLTTVAVFLPIVFIEGMVAKIFRELALTVTFSLAMSLVTALTVVPMLCSKLLVYVAVKDRKNKILIVWDYILDSIDNIYGVILKWSLNHKIITLLIVAVIFGFSISLIPMVGAEFFPASDQGQFTVSIESPLGSLLDETDKYARHVEELIDKIPEVEKMSVTVGNSSDILSETSSGNSATINVTLVPLKERDISTAKIVDNLRRQVEDMPGVKIEISEISSMMGGGSESSSVPISYSVKGDDWDKLREYSNMVAEAMKTVEGTREVITSITDGRPEAQIIVDRDRASVYGLSASQISSAIRTAVQGRVATKLKYEGKEIDIRVEYPEEARKTLEQIKTLTVISNSGYEIPLSNVASIIVQNGPTSINRENQKRIVTVSSKLFERDINSVNRDIQEKIAALDIPDEYTVTAGGDYQSMVEAFVPLVYALLLSIVLIYMVMAAQFETLIHPFVIIFSIPLAYTGSIIIMAIAQKAFSVPAFIGVIMLAGIVVNNAIVLVDYINVLRREQNMDRREAILKAGPVRLRPILMTTLTTILGLVPLAMGTGEGAESQQPLALVVVGGLISSTLLTLVVIPIIYTFFDSVSHSVVKVLKKVRG